jgi:hypothetical protein
MERDATSNAPPATPADAVPPFALESVRITGFVGLGLTALGAGLSLAAVILPEATQPVLNFARLCAVFLGLITVGAAISMRPGSWWTWAMGTVASLLAWPGLPADWDSFRLLARALAGVSAAGSIVAACTPVWQTVLISAAVLYHFTGIFMATTSPPPTPWLTEQVFRYVYNPYLQFVYLRNAYHFYSPEPGPASLLAFFLKTEVGTTPTGEPEYKYQWVVLPTRPADLRDPLGLGYYRRLSLTEQLARGSPGLAIPTDQFEKTEMWYRRYNQREVIPFHPADNVNIQYRLPNPDVIRYLLPSYASHVILEHTPDKHAAARTTVKVYRLEHRTMPPDQFTRRLADGGYQSPYHPVTYRPFFLGEFDVHGKLLNPQEDLLYWLIPILPADPNDKQLNPYKKAYLDYMSVHALELSPNEVLAADEKAGRVFNWSQLK